MSKNRILLAGKPNAGKSSLFNLLTGLNQKIGNYSGVTVERREGIYKDFIIEDLPGLRSLRTELIDESISRDALLHSSGSPIIYIVNGMQLLDSLMLFSEIADLQIPMLVVINFKDDLEKNKVELNTAQLEGLLGCKVLLMNSKTGEGFESLEQQINSNGFSVPNAVCLNLYDEFDGQQFSNQYRNNITSSNQLNEQLEQDYFKRHKIVSAISSEVSSYEGNPNGFLESTQKWDKILLHPIWGIVLLLATILVMFQCVFYLADIPMGWIDSFFAAASEWTNEYVPIPWLADMISNGILPGLGGVLIFIPQIAILFFLLGVLEQTGYLSRISLLSNRFLQRFGLSGQSVVPLMSSWHVPFRL